MTYEFDGKKYEKASGHQKEWGERLIEELALKGTERILDLGCGDGMLTAQLSRLVPKGEVVGIDASQGMIEAALPKQRANLSFLRMDINDLKFDREFDLIFAGDPLGWFEDLYSRAGEDSSIIPWADMKPNSNLIEWLDRNESSISEPALKIGSGLGDDAEELARRGFETTAFDISESAIARARERFPDSSLAYIVADLFTAPQDWKGKFSFVLESYTLQVLPPELRSEAARCIASFVAPGGTLLVITRGRGPDEPEGKMPCPLTRSELSLFETHGLQLVQLEDYIEAEEPPVRRFRAAYIRPI